MGKLRTIVYTLDDGTKINCRQLAKVLGVTESAARNRLNRSSNPKNIYKPYEPKAGSKRPWGSKKKLDEQKKVKDSEMWKLVMKNI
tara:strand:- start:4045 stop:4302 length:258 start_codon:yes stop_codon:yes gene_type:complete